VSTSPQIICDMTHYTWDMTRYPCDMTRRLIWVVFTSPQIICDMTHYTWDMTLYPCDMTRRLPWVVCTSPHDVCDMTHYTWDITHYMCDMTRRLPWVVCTSSDIHVTWLIICVTHSYVIFVTHMSESCHTYEWVVCTSHDVHVTWLIDSWYMWHDSSHVGHDSLPLWHDVTRRIPWVVSISHDTYVTWLIIRVPQLIHTCDKTHSYVWQKSFIRDRNYLSLPDVSMTVLIENATPLKSTISRLSDSSACRGTNSYWTLGPIWICTKESEFCNLVDFGGVAFLVESVIRKDDSCRM